jgi:tRNA threonylcarbamoyladenosine biosynthesis protein TsaB
LSLSKYPLCLGLDTTANWCSAALVDDAKILSFRSQKIGRGHAERLADMVQDVLTEAGITPADIDKLSVCVGPGSFTGLRVGLSFAKGFALPHNIPIVGLSALEVWAAMADPEQNKTLCAVADVRRGQILSQIYKNGQALHAPKLSNVDGVSKLPKIIVGGGAKLLGAEVASTYICPATLAWLGMLATPDIHPAEPLYHRPPDAKLPGGKTLRAV